MNFSFGLGSRSKKTKDTSDSRRKKSDARERTRARHNSDDSVSWSDTDQDRGPRRKQDRDHSRDDKDYRHREPSRPRLDKHRTTSSNYHSSASSGRSRHRPQRTNSMTDTRHSTEARKSFSTSKSSLPYPQFSKAHSREAPSSSENLSKRSHFTPEHTDVGEQRSPRRVDPYRASRHTSGVPPPSPPLTAAGSSRSNLRRPKSASSVRRDLNGSPGKDVSNAARNPVKTSEPSSPTKHLRSLRAAEEGASSAGSSPFSVKGLKIPEALSADGTAQKAADRTPTNTSPIRKTWTTALRASPRESAVSGSDATSVTATRKTTDGKSTVQFQRPASKSNPGTPAAHLRSAIASKNNSPERQDSGHATPVIEVMADDSSVIDGSVAFDPNDSFSAPPPPPPPPPLSEGPTEIPTVDYLLQHGGLLKQIPRQFTLAQNPPCPQSYSQYPPPHPNGTTAIDVSAIFAPYSSLLDNYQNVINRQGSLAVATGYKSVARRLLDRLETVFARNISSEVCNCVLCKLERQTETGPSRDQNVSWGEVLELVSGRRELPAWPPFVAPTTSATATSAGLGLDKPMQKVDGDIPEEYRDHYIRQSKKTKQSVDKWLASQPEEQAAVPTEIDDETLTTIMLTYLDTVEERSSLVALIHGLPALPDPRSPTPVPTGPKPDIMAKTAIALKRLYYLPALPREPECAMYLLNNTHLHSALATLAAISAQEWEILISGRFDGFLVSGAENQFPSMGPIPSRGPAPFTRGPSRGPTPFRSAPSRGPISPSRTATPALNGGINGSSSPGAPAPVQLDEETEIAVLGEVEREIYAGMEQLEDALEALHVKAETVRTAIMERSAGLSMQAHQRRSAPEELRAVMGTPYTGMGDDEVPTWNGMPATPFGFRSASTNGNGLRNLNNDDDDGMDDAASLAPDDSASNIGFRERRRKHRHRHDAKSRSRKTPAPVEEEDEEGSEG